MAYSDCNVLVIGYGQSGKAVAKKAAELNKKAYVYDKKSGFLSEEEAKELIKNKSVALSVISPGVPYDCALSAFSRENGVEVISELEYGASFLNRPIAAITGTNGKTTTVTLLDKMIKESGKRSVLCGNVGFPVTSASGIKSDFAVLECSSFQLEGIKAFKPKVAAILNVSPDHIDRHKSFENYFAIKSKITENQDESDFLVLNKNLDGKIKTRAKTYCFSATEKTNGAHLEKDNIVFGNGEYVTGLYNVRLLGKHNVENVLAAVTMAKLLKISNVYIERAVSTFYGVPHRIAFVREIDGVKYYNDSKGTNIASALVAAEAMKGNTVLILGGKDKGISYDALFEALPKKVTAAVVFGENAESILLSAEKFGFQSVKRCKTLKECVLTARYLAKDGNVLLSPATSSFDMFADFEERGERFEEIVKSL